MGGKAEQIVTGFDSVRDFVIEPVAVILLYLPHQVLMPIVIALQVFRAEFCAEFIFKNTPGEVAIKALEYRRRGLFPGIHKIPIRREYRQGPATPGRC